MPVCAICGQVVETVTSDHIPPKSLFGTKPNNLITVHRSDQMFSWWHRVREWTLRRSSVQVYISGFRAEVREALTPGAVYGCMQTAATCHEFIAHKPKLWTFIWQAQATNNAAEQALRHAVLWRKRSGRTDSNRASRLVEWILSIWQTCRQRGRGRLEYVEECCQAHLAGTDAPSLLATDGSQLGVA
jgi:transposase